MVYVNPGQAHCFPMNMNLAGFNTNPHTAAPATTMPFSVRSTTMSFYDDPTMKIRKPYTITKSRENWTEQEHDKFLEALHLFDRDWKKIEAFVGSKTVIQIVTEQGIYVMNSVLEADIQSVNLKKNEWFCRYEATHRNTFSRFRRMGLTNISLPPRPKRKANHPYPQKASKTVALTSPNALVEHEYIYSTDSQPMINTPNLGLMLSNVITPNPVIKEELGVPENCCSTSSSGDKQRTRTVTETTEQESCEKSHRVMPNFAEVYSFIASLFDPETRGHVQRLKQMDPINLETVLLLMKNLSINLTSPEFEEQRKLISSYNNK